MKSQSKSRVRSGARLLHAACAVFALLLPVLECPAGQVTPPLFKSFGFPGRSESAPSDLLLATDGMLYGTASLGGMSNSGCIFRMQTNGADYEVLHTFIGAPLDGASPETGLLEGQDGLLYGVTYSGGISNLGCLFRLSRDGAGFDMLKSFTLASGDAATPMSRLVWGTNGLLYGTTVLGGAYKKGAVFQMAPNGAGFQLAHSFNQTNGANPCAELLSGSDGRLYGVAESGGGTTNGVVFGMNTDGGGFAVLHSFGSVPSDGLSPSSGLIEDGDGFLYGATSKGGISNQGTIYRLAKDGGGYATLFSFQGQPSGDGENPLASLCLATDGMLYGTAQTGGGKRPGHSVQAESRRGRVLHPSTVRSRFLRWPVSAMQTDRVAGWQIGRSNPFRGKNRGRRHFLHR